MGVAADGICVIDRDGRCSFINEAGASLLGYEPSELLGRLVQSILHQSEHEAGKGESVPPYSSFLRFFPSSDQEQTGHDLFRRRDGAALLVQYRATPVLKTGAVESVIVRFGAVDGDTQQERAASRLSKQAATALEFVSDGVLIAEPSGRITFANAAAGRMLGMARDDLVGRSLNDPAWHVSLPGGQVVEERARPFVRALRTKLRVPDEVIEVRAGLGNRIVVAVSATPLLDSASEVEAVVIAFRDLTEQSRAEAARDRSHADMAAILNSGPQAIIMVGRDRVIRAFNDKSAALVEQVTGMRLRAGEPADRYLGREVEDFNQSFERALAGQTTIVEREIRVGEHDLGWHEIRFDPVFAPNGTVGGACISALEIGSRRRSEERLRILAETSGLLASTLDYQQTLANLARLAVPAFADFCVVNILRDEESIARVGVAHVNPAKARIARELETRYPLTPSRTGGVAQVMRTGQTLYEPRTSDATYAGMRRHAEQIALLRAIDMRSLIIVPIMTRGRTFGTITFAITESDYQYQPTDVALAEDIARRAALAIDTARLVDEVQEAARQKDELLALLDTLLESAPIGFAFLDTDLRYLRINQSLANLFGMDASACLGQPIDDLVSSMTKGLAAQARRVIETRQPAIRIEVTGDVPGQSGVPAYWRASLYPVRIKDGPLLGIGMIVADFSAMKLAETERMQLLARAEQARVEAESASQMIERVQSITDTALEHLALGVLLEQLLAQIREMLDADTATILLVDEETETLSAQTSIGLEDTIGRRIRLPVGRGFAGRIAATRQPLIVGDVSTFDVVNPVLAEKGVCSLMGVPLLLGERVIGVVHIGSLTPRVFRSSELHLLQLMAGRIALGIERARLFESEQLARAAAEIAQGRLSFLARASQILASSLDYEETLTSVARLALPELADLCTVSVVNPDGSMHRIVAAISPGVEAAVAEEQRRFPISLDAPFGIAKVFRTGQSELYSHVDKAWFRQITQDADQLRILESIDMSSSMMIPLHARGRAIGVMCFWSSDSRPPYSEDNLALAEELARRCALAVDNAQLYREANRAIRLRDEFLSVAAHELKTPLTTVKGYVQLLDRQIHAPSARPERVERSMSHLRAQVERFEELVSELLDVSRIHTGRLEPHLEACDLSEVAREVMSRFEYAAERTERHRLVFDAPGPVVGHWDGSQLDQVLTNLVSNALKYSPAGGIVSVSIGQREESAEIVVSDQGIGIPPAEQSILFEPFARGAAAAGAATGSGLGLHIAAQIIERHGGTIGVQSEPGVGSTFTVRLPLTPPSLNDDE